MVENIEADLPPDVGTLHAKVSFGEDAAGNLYIVNLGSSSFQPPLGTGSVYRIVTDAVILQGDYNQNGVVDAADYIVWRKNVNTGNVLANDPIGGTIGQAQYDQWRAHFGQTAGSGSGADANATVPEPATMVMLIVTAAGALTRRRFRTWPVSKLVCV